VPIFVPNAEAYRVLLNYRGKRKHPTFLTDTYLIKAARVSLNNPLRNLEILRTGARDWRDKSGISPYCA